MQLANSCIVDGILPPSFLDVNIGSPNGSQRLLSHQTAPRMEENFIKRVEERVSEVFHKKAEEFLPQILEIHTCLRNLQTVLEDAFQRLPTSPPDSSRESTQVSLRIYIWISRNLIRIIDNAKTSLKTG